jgi:large subunit ribosomal protein L22
VEVKAISKQNGLSTRKLRVLVDMVRGRKVDEALSLLQYSRTPLAMTVAKVVKSAAANAENNFQMVPSDLKIVKIFADQARPMKRQRPRARGRAGIIRKRSSHITVIVAEQEA